MLKSEKLLEEMGSIKVRKSSVGNDLTSRSEQSFLNVSGDECNDMDVSFMYMD